MSAELEAAERATATAERLMAAIDRISEILPPPGNPATAGDVNRVRAVLAGLNKDPQ
jgi:hypothetical protein